MSITKSTNSKVNLSIVITFLIVSLASCRSSVTISTNSKFEKSSSNESNNHNEAVGSQAKKVISTARSYKGTHYKFGGCSRSGMDCSGLTTTAFKSVNIQLPRTSQEQSQKYKTVNMGQLKPGD